MEKSIRFLFSATGDSKRAKNTVSILLLQFLKWKKSLHLVRDEDSLQLPLAVLYKVPLIESNSLNVNGLFGRDFCRKCYSGQYIFYIFYSRNPLISLIRDKIVLQLQLTMPGRVSMTLCRKSSISSLDEATACTCSLSLPVTR